MAEIFVAQLGSRDRGGLSRFCVPVACGAYRMDGVGSIDRSDLWADESRGACHQNPPIKSGGRGRAASGTPDSRALGTGSGEWRESRGARETRKRQGSWEFSRKKQERGNGEIYPYCRVNE